MRQLSMSSIDKLLMAFQNYSAERFSNSSLHQCKQNSRVLQERIKI